MKSYGSEPDGAILTFQNTRDGLRYVKTDGIGYTTRYSYRLHRALTDLPSDTGGEISLEQDPFGHTTQVDYGPYNQPSRIRGKSRS
uniref:YD repeat-containing protein n=1 Tax=Candidatus Kentrum sp. FW TaxID=2126338 RepID=A0A450TMZ7_9GAMM|nr:MAG: hypothetical protein BECKFW1821B_GA0114236_11598 [Candidatus Kentron sp. FW]